MDVFVQGVAVHYIAVPFPLATIVAMTAKIRFAIFVGAMQTAGGLSYFRPTMYILGIKFLNA
jgi:hypothetical protein